MSDLLNIMSNLFIIVLYIAGIVGIAAFVRFIWITVRFTYVIKLQKYNRDKMEAEREYNVITAENSQLMVANDNIREDYADTMLKLKDANLEFERILKKIEQKTKELESIDNEKTEAAEKKRGPGRPRKQK